MSSILESILDNILNTDERVGKRGENLIARKLGLIDLFGHKGKVLRNVYLPKDNGETSEIDLLFITKIGIFVIESKNYSGYIFGTDTNQKWTVTLYSGKDFFGKKKTEKIQFYNPIKQNKTHIKWLKNFLETDVRTISLIVFSRRCELKSIDLSSSEDVYVFNRPDLGHVINRCFKKYDECLTEAEIDDIYDKLSVLTDVDEALKLKHIQDIKEKKESMICPLCGGLLILRTATKGKNAGKQFYGCSNYPECRYTKNKE